ncbi:MAG TPA: TonB-dependent receptor [Candidatus Acidoferrales bacterium]|nr:TonB-dependent receptor [Candidatus Acidoferrales bacterium]
MLFFLAVLHDSSFAGTTGKLAGKVTDAETGEPVVGATVLLQGTTMGAATDVNGYYYIDYITPGDYTVVISAVGYQKVVVKSVPIKIDLTFTLDMRMNQETISSKEVVVTAQRPLVQKDLTSTSVTVSSDQISKMPVESVSQIIGLQAGVVGGHFRGGRSDEVGYLVDGLPVTDPFNGSLPLQVDNSTIREIEVISGTFNAEYGQVMSGIVNIVTQDGTQNFHGSLSAYAGDYVTTHTDLFPDVGKLTTLRTRDYEFTLSGPSVILPEVTFFATGRYYDDPGYLYGTRIYNTSDRSPFPLIDPSGNDILDQNGNPIYIMPHTGDSTYVPMNPSRMYSINGKLTYSLLLLKFSYSLFYNNDWNKYFSEAWKWTPDGLMNNYMNNWIHSFQISHVPSADILQTLKFAVNRYDYRGYVYADPYDTRYVDPAQGSPLSSYTFQSGGQQSGRYERETIESIVKWQLDDQVSKNHKIGVGAELDWYKLYDHEYTLISPATGTGLDSVYKPMYLQLGSISSQDPAGNQLYARYPIQFSAYFQDKAEYDIMIINAGLRFDYFKPNAKYLYDLKNPLRDPNFSNAGKMVNASAKTQVSPRLGISFPITDKGIIHFSYGHFFQIPSFSNLYDNPGELVLETGGLTSIMGNPDLNPQRTVMYEIGLQQALAADLSLDFTVYDRDIRNWLGMEIINTYQGVNYARFINRDYANVKGFIVTLDKHFSAFFSAKLDYTFQLAEGDASDPMSVFYNNQSSPPIETNKIFVPLDWDQRNTLNIEIDVGPATDWTVGLIFNYGSGYPYTEDVRVSQGILFDNNGMKPPTYNVDLRAQKTFNVGGIGLNLFLLVYNLLDIENEYGVNAYTGRANDLPIQDITSAGTIIGLNTLQQYTNDPSSYSAPRSLRIGCSLDF